MIHSAEKFIRAVRWKTFFFHNPSQKPDTKDTYGFTSTKAPPMIPELKKFEDGLHNLIQDIEFKPVESKFQKHLNNDIRDIKKSDQLLIPADKTTNFYKVNPKQYNELLHTNITKDYKKAPASLEQDINTGDKDIASNLKLADRINIMAKKEAFITLKDHKPNFKNNPKCRLINPTKSEIGKISKQILEKITTNVKKTTKFQQWKNTNEVIQWFTSIDNKANNSFICFDVVEFYPSITEELLSKAIDFAEKYTTITEHEKHIIAHTKQSLLYNINNTWRKKNTTNFDVTMGSFDGAETCELIGLFMLSQLQDLGINVGLYRDDGLAVCDKTPRQIEQIKKKMCHIFSSQKLKITIDANLKVIDFLDTTMNLLTGTFKPFMKPNNNPLYVHKDSNHPSAVLNNIPDSINRRLSSISSNSATFDESTPAYQSALENSGYKYKLKFKPPEPDTSNNTEKKRSRKRKVTWFNPPFSENVTTNVGKKFLKLVDNCFPTDHPLHKLINRNTVKVSYSCMPNMKQIITSHNKSILKKNIPQEEKPTCNCRTPANCPLGGKCLSSNIVYQATVTREDNKSQETYIGLTETQFKTRYNNHTNSFRNENKRHATTLSQHIWSLKDDNISHSIKWKTMAKASAYSTSSKCCNLCLKEKYYIICKPHLATLNSRNELATDCRHRRKHLLNNLG
jgi:hypothetical protein